MRFSTCPSSPTSTARARPAAIGTNDSCASLGSRRGTITIPAAPDRSDSKALVRSSASSTGPGVPSFSRIAARSSAVGSATCIIPSTNSRSPMSVGMRPALVCGAASRPMPSSSASTDRIEAGDNSMPCPASVLDPTGCPLAR